MKRRQWMATAVSVCALAVAPSAALAGEPAAVGQLIKQTQTATNENGTEQTATSNASSQQTNVYVPIAVASPGSNGGDVSQSNHAENEASSENNNNTEQENLQQQHGAATGAPSNGGDSSKGGYGGQTADQSQKASNHNSTEQKAESEASSRQA